MATPCDGSTLVLVIGDDERKQIETIGLGRFGTHREYDVDPETMIMMEVRPLRSEAGCGRRTSRSSGSKAGASEVLDRRRHLTLEHPWKLHLEWRLPADALIRPYPQRAGLLNLPRRL